LPLAFFSFFFHHSCTHLALHSFPTRRSSDLSGGIESVAHGIALSSASLGESAVESPHVERSLAASRPPRQAERSLERRHMMAGRSEEHTSELQSRGHLVCRLLLEKKKMCQDV